MQKLQADKENRSALIQAGMYALPSARNAPNLPIDDLKRQQYRNVENY